MAAPASPPVPSTPLFSVVIPTYNRLPVLREVLEALDAQEGAPPFEVHA